MSLNTQQARVVDPVLTNVARDYRNATHVGSVLFPRVEVTARGGKILEFGKESFAQLNMRRAPGAEVREVSYRYSDQNFNLVQDALDALIPREHMEDAMTVPKVDLSKRAVKKTQDIMNLGLEIEQAALAQDPANYPAGQVEALAGTDRWDDPASDPQAVIEAAKEAVRRSCGMEPNTMVVSKVGFNALRFHPKIKDQFKYTTADSITVGMLAAYLELEKLAVGKATYLPEGAEAGDFQLKDVWGDNAILAYSPAAPEGMEEPSFGYTYALTGHPFVEQARWEGSRRSWVHGMTYDRVPVIAGPDAGFLLRGVAGE